jgi:uncharacterized protein (TIGR01777 family)
MKHLSPLRIVVAGGTGFLGSPLAETYAEESHDVRVLTRSLAPGESRHESGTGVPGITRVGWKPDGQSGPWAAAIDGADVVINLAGASIGDKRWTPQRKAELRDSRILATRSLVEAILRAAAPPPVLISASGVDYYDSSTDAPKTEDSSPGRSFLSELCQDWEREARKVEARGVRVALVRSGLVLERSGGALPRMMLPFRMFVCGPVACGKQFISWIHRLDWIEMIRWIAQTPEASGPINLTAPHPVTSRTFAKALGAALKRPALLPAPALALKIALGESADYIINGQRAIPARALALGYHFRYPEIDIAFRGLFGD